MTLDELGLAIAEGGDVKVCTIPGCDKPLSARAMCSKHYMRWRRHGDPGESRAAGHWPIADLMAAVNCRSLTELSARLDGSYATLKDQAQASSYRTLFRARETGLTTVMADRYALELGLHPALIWTDWYDIEEAS